MKLWHFLTGAAVTAAAAACMLVSTFAAEGDFHLYYGDANDNVFGFNELSDGTLELISSSIVDPNVVVPSTVDGLKVTKIAEKAFTKKTTITSVVIPDTVTSIEDYSFLYCENLESFTASKNLKELGAYAFSQCKSLTTVNLFDGLEAIKDGTFANCSALKSLKIPNTVTEIQDHAFWFAGLTSIEIPDSVTNLEKHAFDNCSDLTEVKLSNSITEINEYAFTSCTSLKSIEIPASVTTIGNYAFSYSGLTSLDIPATVKEIRSNAFAYMPITSVYIPATVENWSSGVFTGCKYLTTAEFDNDMTEIPESIFNGCLALKTVTIPEKVKIIHANAFRATALTALTIPDSVTQIESGAFRGCTALKSVKLPKNLARIEYDTFNGCESLASVEIPESVTTINQSAFVDCTSLKTVTIPASVTSIGKFISPVANDIEIVNVFRGCPDDLTVRGYTNSVAEAYADKFDINFEAIGKVNSDIFENKDTKIKVTAPAGAIPENAVLNVKAVEDSSGKDSVAYDITITAGGETVAVNYAVTVTIPVPASLAGADNYYVYYNDGDKLTDMNAKLVGSDLVFTTDHFSQYIVTTNKQGTTIRGDVNNSGGKPNNDDLIMLAQYLANWKVDINLEAANVDGDAKGEVNNDDLIILAQLLAGWNV